VSSAESWGTIFINGVFDAQDTGDDLILWLEHDPGLSRLAWLGLRRLLNAHRVQHPDPRADIGVMIVPGAAAEEIAVDAGPLLGIDAAANFEIKAALGNAGHASSLDATGSSRDFYPMTDAGNWL
jgi:hypothetical protein